MIGSLPNPFLRLPPGNRGSARVAFPPTFSALSLRLARGESRLGGLRTLPYSPHLDREQPPGNGPARSRPLVRSADLKELVDGQGFLNVVLFFCHRSQQKGKIVILGTLSLQTLQELLRVVPLLSPAQKNGPGQSAPRNRRGLSPSRPRKNRGPI